MHSITYMIKFFKTLRDKNKFYVEKYEVLNLKLYIRMKPYKD